MIFNGSTYHRLRKPSFLLMIINLVSDGAGDCVSVCVCMCVRACVRACVLVLDTDFSSESEQLLFPS